MMLKKKIFVILSLVFIILPSVLAAFFNPITPPPQQGLPGPIGPIGPAGPKGDPGMYTIGVGLYTDFLNMSNETILNVNLSFLDSLFNDSSLINNLSFDLYTNYYNKTAANATFYPLSSNPAGYLTNASFSNGSFVLRAGDTMTGNLNMSNNNITDVDILFVHNISGRSPITIMSPVTSNYSITADTFFGNINGQNGTIFGVTITNGTISNLRVIDSAYFDTNVTFNGSLIPELNNTYSLGVTDKYWKSFYVVDLVATNITSPDISNLYNITSTIIVDLANKLNITDQRYNDTLLIIGVNTSVWNELNNKLNITDQRYNDTLIIQVETTNRIGNDTVIDNRVDVLNSTTLKNTGNQVLDGNFSILGSRLDVNGGWTNPYGTSIVNGNIYTDGSLYLTGNISSVAITHVFMNGSWLPTVDNVFSLGNSTNRWLNGYISNLYSTTLTGALNASYIQNAPWAINSDVTILINSLNVSILQETLNRISNDSFLQLQIDSLNTTKLNVTDQRYNDSALIYSLLNTTIYYPINVSTVYGTDTGGNNVGNLSYVDNQQYNVTENGGVNALEVRVNYSNVSTFNNIQIYAWYSGSSSHGISVELWDYSTSVWEQYFVFSSTSNFILYNLPVIDTAVHTQGGLVQLRFKHIENGVASHKLSIDLVILQNGLTLIGNGQGVDPRYLLVTGANNMTGNLTFTVGNGLNASDVQNSPWLNITDQRYNDTLLINAVNTSNNIQSLGFNTTLQLYGQFLNITDQRYNDSLNWIFESGSGISSIRAKGVRGVGQIRLITGSSNVTGIGTEFLGGGLRNLDSYYAFYIGDSRYFVFPISSNTSAILTATLFGSAMNWTGANTTTDFYLLINNASGDESRAFGIDSTASGLASLALGKSTLASGSYSFASGDTTVANASGAVALGSSTVASGLNSFASGFSTTASGNTAFASGQNTVASGLYAVAMGYGNTAGSYAFGFGRETIADAVGAVSMGYKTNATSYAELAIGRYNIGGGTFNSWVITDPAFEIGMGSSPTVRANALTVFKNGNTTINGNLSVTGSTTINTNLNVTGALYGKMNPDMMSVITSDVSTTSATVYSNTTLTLNLRNASTYIIICHLLDDAAAVTTGVQLQVNTTGSPTTVRTTWTSMSSASAMESFTGTSTSSNSFADTGSSTVTSVDTLQSYVVTAASPSRFTINVRSEVGGSAAVLRAGSICEAVIP